MAGLHDGDDGVGRAKVNANNLSHVKSLDYLVCLGISTLTNVKFSLHLSRGPLADLDLGRTEQPASEAVAILQYLDDVVSRDRIVDLVGDGLVLYRVEGITRVDRNPLETTALQDLLEVAFDRLDARGPVVRFLRSIGWSMFGTATEVVEDRQELEDELGRGKLDHQASLGLDPFLIVLEISRRPLGECLEFFDFCLKLCDLFRIWSGFFHFQQATLMKFAIIRKRHRLIGYLGTFLVGLLLGNFFIDYPLTQSTLIGSSLLILGLSGFGYLHDRLRHLRFPLGCLIGLIAGMSYVLIVVSWGDRANSPEVRTHQATVVSLPSVERSQSRFIVELPDRQGRASVTTYERPALFYGDRIRFLGAISPPVGFEDFNYPRYLQARGIDHVARSVTGVEKIGEAEGWHRFRRLLYQIKVSIDAAIRQSVRAPESEILIGLIAGDRVGLPEALTETFTLAGIVHILSVSGYNVAVILKTFAGVILGWLHKRLVFILTIILALSYFLVTGGNAPILRATIFGLLAASGELLGRRRHMLLLLLWTAVLMALLNPLIVRYDLSFGLSLLATLGLVLFSPLIERGFTTRSLGVGWPVALREALVTTLAAQTLVIPILAFHFQTVSLLSLPANLLILWAVPYAMFFGLLTGLVGQLVPQLGALIGGVAWLLVRYIRGVAELLVTLIPWQLSVSLNEALLIGSYLAIGFLYLRWRKSNNLEIRN